MNQDVLAQISATLLAGALAHSSDKNNGRYFIDGKILKGRLRDDVLTCISVSEMVMEREVKHE